VNDEPLPPYDLTGWVFPCTRPLRRLRQRYREGQEDQLGSLGLVANIIILWNTIYIEAILQQLRREKYPLREEDVARLSPLGHQHINLLGRYSFTLP
jgi:hypothetical protein